MLSIHSDPIGELGTRDTGGMSVYIRELARELGRRGHLIDIYTRSQEDQEQSVKQLFENVRLIHLAIPEGDSLSKLALNPYLPRFFQALKYFCAAENLVYDLIHSHYWLSGRLGIWAQRLWNWPHITTFHTLGTAKNLTGTGEPEPGFRIAAEKEIVSACQRIIAPTARERSNLIRLYGASEAKIGVVPCGVDLKIFFPQEKTAARNKLGLDPRDLLLLYVGRFDPLKGLNNLLKAMTCLENNHGIRLVIVGGDGNTTPEYQTLARDIRKLGD